MNTYYIPNTNVEAQVINHPIGDPYVSLFLGRGENGNGKNIASVNAGTSNYSSVFSVGLGGINGSFAKALTKAGQTVDDYQQIHQNIYDIAGSGQSVFESKFSATDPIQFSLMLKPNPSFKLPKYDGIVFVDVFNSNQLPHSNPLNYSMVYLVPPEYSNYPTEADFLLAIEASCVTILEAVDQYNSKHANSGNALGLELIEDIRMCLFSGGIYRGSSTQDKVALHNLAGLKKGLISLGTNPSIKKIDFENSFDEKTNQEVFRVIQSKLSTK